MSSRWPRARPELAPRGAPAPAADDDQTTWLITFSDLTLQLFAFVLVGLVLGGAGKAAERRLDPPPPPAADPGPRAGFLVPPVPAERDGPVPDEPHATGRLVDLGERLRDVVRAQGREHAVAVTMRESELVVALADAISFPSGSADLLPDALPILAAVRALVAAVPDVRVHVEGHTDDQPIQTVGLAAPGFPSNLDLSLARAARVAHELGAGDPALAARTVATGYGEHRPIAPNALAEGRARNRRVEIWLVPGDRPRG